MFSRKATLLRESATLSSRLSAERRKVVVLAACIAAGSGLFGLLAQNHTKLAIGWLVVMAGLAVYVIGQLVKIKRSRR